MGDLVSVIIPTYNRGELISAALDSVINQTYKELEIIIVDDNSSDNTFNVVEKYCNLDTRINYIKNNKNLGGGGARNIGIKASSGDYIAFLDSDDIWYPEKISRQMSEFQKNPLVQAVFSNYIMSQYETNEVVANNNSAISCSPSKIFTGNYLGTTSSMIAKKETLIKIGMFDSQLRSCQDWDIYIRLIIAGEIAYVPDLLLTQYYHGKRLSSNGENVIQGISHLIMKMPKYLSEAKVSLVKKKAILSRLYYRQGIYYCNFNRRKEAKKSLVNALGSNIFNLRCIKLAKNIFID